MFGVLLGECIDIRYSQGEYNWLEAWIVKTFSGFLDASFGSEASSRCKKISFLTFTSVRGQVFAYAFLNSLVDFSLSAFNSMDLGSAFFTFVMLFRLLYDHVKGFGFSNLMFG